MSERTEHKQDANTTTEPWSIGQTAEFELWQRGRDAIRRRLGGAVTSGYLYLIAALVVGAYLIIVVAAVARGSVVMDGWDSLELDLSWNTQIVWCYAALALFATIAYPLMLMLIHGKLPSILSRLMRLIPGIGSTMCMVEMGEFCQSIYQSVAQSQTYGQAFTQASQNMRDSGMRHWAGATARRVEAGQSLASVLRTSPILDQPLPAIRAFFLQGDISQADSLRVWHHAAEECHLQSQRRLKRTTQAISVSCMLAAVFLAAFGMLLAATITNMVLQGWSTMIYPRILALKWMADLGTSQIFLLPASVGILLLAGTVHAIVGNSLEYAVRPLRSMLIAISRVFEWLLWTLGLIALIIGLPHPITIVLAVMILVSLVIAGRWRYREEVESLNPWLRLAAETTVSIPVLVEGMADGFHGRLAGQARAFVARVSRGESIVDAVRRSQFPVQSDALAAIVSANGNGVTQKPNESSRNAFASDGTTSRGYYASESPVLVSEQFVYVIVTIFLAWMISRTVRSIIIPLFTELFDEFSSANNFSTPGLTITVTIGNVVVTCLVIWLLAAFLIRRLPLWMVRWVPWFGQLAVDRWRCEVLQTVAHGVRSEQSASEILNFAPATTRVRWIRRRCKIAKQSVDNGAGLAASLRRAKLVSSREQAWLSNAEKNGVLAETIDQIVGNIRRQQTLLWKARKAWLVPLATVGVGLFVLVHGVVVFRFLSMIIGGRA